ncbi:9540_t:CDS:1 [Funneliformis geosporum]|uniref:9540_t:CDS:1 n=1 Tax=Funneliformis geosporum TaxID=1117311 RepID=A0A9W4T049_9GLOM|nr:9540_t:CDS:1 [Funneliformis geosporum]
MTKITSHKVLKRNLLQSINSQRIPSTQLMEQQNTRNIISPPNLTLPFPPHIVPENLINLKSCKLPSKPPNAFFIYRKVYTNELVAQNMRFKMTDVSSWVSISWKLEPEEVRTKYKEIAKEVRKIYKQTKLDATDESHLSPVKDSPTSLPIHPLNKDHVNSDPELIPEFFVYGQSNDTELQNPVVDNDLDYYNNIPLLNPSIINNPTRSGLWQYECYNLPPTIFENISAELSYSEYMVLPNNSNNVTPEFEAEPWVFEDFDVLYENTDSFEMGHQS